LRPVGCLLQDCRAALTYFIRGGWQYDRACISRGQDDSGCPGNRDLTALVRACEFQLHHVVQSVDPFVRDRS
jgi:hypothetical protein